MFTTLLALALALVPVASHSSPALADDDVGIHYYVEPDEGDTTQPFNLPDARCDQKPSCPPGAVFEPVANGGQRIKGCSATPGGTPSCTGTCVWCAGGGGAGSYCIYRRTDTCTTGHGTPSSCGKIIPRPCYYSATAPIGYPNTDNGCYCQAGTYVPTNQDCFTYNCQG